MEQFSSFLWFAACHFAMHERISVTAVRHFHTNEH